MLAATLELELDPVAAGLDRVAVDEQRPALIGHDDVEHAAIAEIGQRDGAAVEGVCRADHLRHVGEPAGAVVHPHPLSLIAGEAAPFIAGQFAASPMIVLWPPAITPKSYQ